MIIGTTTESRVVNQQEKPVRDWGIFNRRR